MSNNGIWSRGGTVTFSRFWGYLDLSLHAIEWKFKYKMHVIRHWCNLCGHTSLEDTAILFISSAELRWKDFEFWWIYVLECLQQGMIIFGKCLSLCNRKILR